MVQLALNRIREEDNKASDHNISQLPSLSDEANRMTSRIEKNEKKVKSKGLTPVRRVSKSVTNLLETKEAKLLNTNKSTSSRMN